MLFTVTYVKGSPAVWLFKHSLGNISMDVDPLQVFDANGAANLGRDARIAILRADIVIAVDVATQREFTVFGTPSFEETVRIGESVAMRTVRVEIDERLHQLDQLVDLVRTVKGRIGEVL
jgi:hypothetical protein